MSRNVGRNGRGLGRRVEERNFFFISLSYYLSLSFEVVFLSESESDSEIRCRCRSQSPEISWSRCRSRARTPQIFRYYGFFATLRQITLILAVSIDSNQIMTVFSTFHCIKKAKSG